MNNDNLIKDLNFTSPSNIVIIILIFIIIILIFKKDLFTNSSTKSELIYSQPKLYLPPAEKTLQLPIGLNNNIIYNFIRKNNISGPSLNGPYNTLSIYIVCNRLDKLATNLNILNLGCININNTDIIINKQKFTYTKKIKPYNLTIISCIITENNVTMSTLGNNIILSKPLKNKFNCQTLNIPQNINLFIENILIYNTAINNTQNNKIILYLAKQYNILLPILNMTELNNITQTINTTAINTTTDTIYTTAINTNDTTAAINTNDTTAVLTNTNYTGGITYTEPLRFVDSSQTHTNVQQDNISEIYPSSNNPLSVPMRNDSTFDSCSIS